MPSSCPIDFGAIRKPANDQPINIRCGADLCGTTLDHFIGAGYSFRFDFRRHRQGESRSAR
jgi:hypothetical protein